MRNISRRSFTVEAKSGGRRASTIIPTRVVAPLAPRPALFLSDAVPAEPVAEKRRILPSLIVPEVEPEAPQAAEEPPVRRPRGRPRKVVPSPIPVAAAPPEAARPAPVVEPQAPVVSVQPAQPVRKRKEVPAADLLPRGERWKTRRLGRWSR